MLRNWWPSIELHDCCHEEHSFSKDKYSLSSLIHNSCKETQNANLLNNSSTDVIFLEIKSDFSHAKKIFFIKIFYYLYKNINNEKFLLFHNFQCNFRNQFFIKIVITIYKTLGNWNIFIWSYRTTKHVLTCLFPITYLTKQFVKNAIRNFLRFSSKRVNICMSE